MPGKVATYVDKAHETTSPASCSTSSPTPSFSAFTAGEILQVLLVAILFGIALALVGDRGERLLGGFEQVLTA
jgi:aerobic C4-dicarboxylate transport protein